MSFSLSTVQRWEKHGAKPACFASRELVRLFQEAGAEKEYARSGKNVQDI